VVMNKLTVIAAYVLVVLAEFYGYLDLFDFLEFFGISLDKSAPISMLIAPIFLLIVLWILLGFLLYVAGFRIFRRQY